MKKNPKILLLALPILGFACRTFAQEEHRHDPAEVEKLGTVHFPVSCTAGATAKFERAVALLHSFAYEQAEEAFRGVAAADPSCAMAHWGVAMSLFHPIWAAANPAAAPTPAQVARGSDAVEKAKALGVRSEREQDYVDAVSAYYREAGQRLHPARALSFAEGMERVAQRHPEDQEAAIFYALALLGTPSPTDRTYAVQRRAAELLNRVLPQAPDHPGVAHYLIHSFDYPALAELALPAARAYAKIAPSAPHALHMPSHIFTRLALWDESIGSNLASAECARGVAATAHPGATSFDELHALDYLEYAYLQTGRDEEAKGVRDAIDRVDTLDEPQFAAAYALAAVPARYALERRDWIAAAGLALHPPSFPWARFLNAEAITQFARAVGGARGGRLSTAREALVRLKAIQQQLAEKKDDYWAGQVEIQSRASEAWVAQAEGRKAEALSLMASAADLEDATDKHPVTPGVVLPAREMLGDLLLEQGVPKEALVAYQGSMRIAPGRFNGLLGAARAARDAGAAETARDYFNRLATLCLKASGSRKEVAEARAAAHLTR
jgi:integrase